MPILNESLIWNEIDTENMVISMDKVNHSLSKPYSYK